ncbi:hypothetical protein FGB62_402g01 [Gracilaria domingensis]|nr:hypothetical protein FGB62_402g01 [Gracilaria domingensis]
MSAALTQSPIRSGSVFREVMRPLRLHGGGCTLRSEQFRRVSLIRPLSSLRDAPPWWFQTFWLRSNYVLDGRSPICWTTVLTLLIAPKQHCFVDDGKVYANMPAVSYVWGERANSEHTRNSRGITGPLGRWFVMRSLETPMQPPPGSVDICSHPGPALGQTLLRLSRVDRGRRRCPHSAFWVPCLLRFRDLAIPVGDPGVADCCRLLAQISPCRSRLICSPCGFPLQRASTIAPAGPVGVQADAASRCACHPI